MLRWAGSERGGLLDALLLHDTAMLAAGVSSKREQLAGLYERTQALQRARLASSPGRGEEEVSE